MTAPDIAPLPAGAPEPSIEERVILALDYGDVLGKPIPRLPEGSDPVLAENFLDAYPEGSPHRQETEDLLIGFLDLPPDDPDYIETKAYVGRILKTRLYPDPADTAG